jgi:hypothetical protein
MAKNKKQQAQVLFFLVLVVKDNYLLTTSLPL